MNARCLLLAFSLSLALGSVSQAEWRDFEGTNGQIIRAELVSYRGTKVSLKREDGREFEVEANVFSLDDQIYIKQWMTQTSEKLDYNLRIDASPKKADTNIINENGYRYKTDEWYYEITVQNLSRDVMKGLTIKYRIVYEEEVSEEYRYDTPEIEVMEGAHVQEGEMAFNNRVEFETKLLALQEIDFGSDEYDDELRGCLVRVENADGKVVMDWSPPLSTMKGFTWENTDPGPSPLSN